MSISEIGFTRGQALTAEQMLEVDRVAVEEFNLQIIQMMEIAAFQMARLMLKILSNLEDKKILVVAGKGNNGGDAIACARFLYNWGAIPTIIAPKELNQNAKHHAELAERVGIEVRDELNFNEKYTAIVDGILGYSIKGVVRKPYSEWICKINSLSIPVFSYDIPSGLDPNNGYAHGTTVKAAYTLTLAYPKKGLFAPEAKKYVGEVYLGDIGIPAAVYRVVGQKFPSVNYKNPFSRFSIVKLI